MQENASGGGARGERGGDISRCDFSADGRMLPGQRAHIRKMVETEGSRTPRPGEDLPGPTTGLAGACISPAVPPPAAYRRASRCLLGSPYRRREGCTPALWRRSQPAGERLGRRGRLQTRRPERVRARQLLFRHLFNEVGGDLGLLSGLDLPCRTHSSPLAPILYHHRSAPWAAGGTCNGRLSALTWLRRRLFNGGASDHGGAIAAAPTTATLRVKEE